jgi:predicted permease
MRVRTLLARLRYIANQRRHDDDLREEMAVHRDMTRRHLERRGLAADEADAASRRTFGNDALARNLARDVWIWPGLQDISQDMRFALRMLVKDRRFTIAAIVALALGIGVNNSVFAIFNAAVIKDVPFEQADRLVAIRTLDARGREGGVSFAELRDLIGSANAFETLAGTTGGVMNVSGEAQAAERFRGAFVSASTFGVLRSTPAIGRTFLPQDDAPGATPVVIIGFGVWQRRYGADPSAVGRTIKVNDVPAVIVGVMPEGFSYPGITEMWQPLALAAGASASTRDARSVAVVGRLKPASSLAAARSDAELLAGRFAESYPATNRDIRLVARLLRDTRPDTTSILLTLMSAVGLVLLIACANLANLMLARSAYRSREIALRTALGASRWRIVRQVLIECLLLAAVAGVLGLGLSVIGVQRMAIAFNAIEPGTPLAQTKPYWVDVSMDYVVYTFVGGLCLFTSLLFGILPALQISKADAAEVLKDSSRTAGGVRSKRWSAALMIAEVALTLIVLTTTALLWRNFVTLQMIDLVVNTTDVVTFQIGLPSQKFRTHSDRMEFIDRLDERLRGLHAVAGAALASQTPIVSFSGPQRALTIEGRPPLAGQTPPGATFAQVGPRYFETLAVPLLRGRAFDERDAMPGREAAIVNQRFATTYFPDADPVGKRIQLAGSAPAAAATPWLTIVGVSQTVPSFGPGRPLDLQEPVVYAPLALDPSPRALVVIARAHSGLAATVSAMREEVRALDPDLPLFGIETLDVAVGRARDSIVASWFTVLALIAIVVAAVGLYAVAAHTVAQRTQEIGVRIALGARSGQVVWLFVRRTSLLLVAGIAFGVAGAFWTGQFLQSFHPQTPAHDPLTLVAVVLLLALVAGIASVLPARRAARVDPATALRAE